MKTLKRLTTLAPLMMLLLTPLINARDITLKQAMEMARTQSHELKSAEAITRAADWNLSEAKRGRLPSFRAEAFAGYQNDIARLDLALPGLGAIHREIGSKEHYQFDAIVQLPLYTGGRLSGGIEHAASLTAYQNAIRDATRERLALAVQLAYFNLVATAGQLKAAQAASRRAEVLANDIQSMYTAGTVDSVDLLEVRHAVNRSELGVKEANNAQQRASIELAILLGLDLSERINPSDDLPAPSPGALDTVALSSDKPELRASEAMISAQQAIVGMRRAAYFPSLAVTGGYHYGKPNIDLFNNTWNDDFTIGASLVWSFNLGNQTAASLNAARFNLEAAREERQQTETQLTKGAELARQQLALAYDRYQIAEKEVKVQKDAYRLSLIRHHDGALSTNHLLELETTLSEAEANLSASLAGFYQAKANYWYATGSENLLKGIE